MDYLDLPIKKIAAINTHIAMTPSLENTVVSNKDRVVQEVKEILGV
jgi:pyruvate/2-oxoglutarate/acetoin dehydrogenase E1 component